MQTDYFSSKRDKTFPYFCGACVVGKTEEQMSRRDTRYCLECQVFIEKDSKLSGSKYSIPPECKATPKPISTITPEPILAPQNSGGRESPIEKEKEVLLHTNSKKPQLYQNPTEDRPKSSIGGRPRKDVPVSLIHKLSDEGLSVGRIVKELKTQGQIISAMTIQRVLSGARK